MKQKISSISICERLIGSTNLRAPWTFLASSAALQPGRCQGLIKPSGGFIGLGKDFSLREAPQIQGSEKWGIWGIIFPDKAKSHGHFGLKTTYKRGTDRQTERDGQTVMQIDRRKNTFFCQTALLLLEIKFLYQSGHL